MITGLCVSKSFGFGCKVEEYIHLDPCVQPGLI